MKYTCQIVLYLLVFLWTGITAYGQKLKYDVVLFGNKIGETTIEQKDSGGMKHYILSSHSEAKVLFTDKKSYMLANALFDKEGKLFFSFFEHVKDDEKIVTQTRWDKTRLLIDRNGKKSEIPDAIKNTIIGLYFSEPKHLTKIFSERLGKYIELSEKTEGVYHAMIEGVNNIFKYKNGKLVEVEMTKGFIGSVYLKLVP